MNHRKSILSAAIVASLGFAAQAHAQETDTATDLDTVTVVGIRGSMEKSLDVKREAKSHVEVVTAEDIGKMPDKNIADSLQRVSGVTVSSAGANEGGFDENDRVSMRGTNPSLTQTLFNGHNIASGDWFVLNQTGTVGRSVSYTLLPSELVSQIVVHKTSQASLVEGGVAGSVDIITRKPLEFAENLTAEASIGAVYSDLPDKTEPQFSGLLNWKNDANTFGVMVQAFSEERSLRRDGQEILGYEQVGADSALAATNPDLAGVWYPTMIGSALFEQKRKRTGGLIDLQFKPLDNLTLDLNAFVSNQDAENYNRNYLLWVTHFLAQGNGQAPNPGYVVRNGTLVQADFDPVAGTTYGVYDQISRPDSSADSSYVSFDADWDVSDKLSLKGQIGTSRGTGETPTQDVAEWNVGVGSGGGWGLNGVGAADWYVGEDTSAQTTSLGWIFGYQDVKVEDKEDWAQLDGEYFIDSGAMTSLQFGLRYAEHSRESKTATGQGPGCIDANGNAVPFDWSQANWCPVGTDSPLDLDNIPVSSHNYPGNFADGLGGSFPRDIWYLTPEQLAEYNRLTNRNPVTRSDWAGIYALEEKSSAAYVQLNMEGDRWSGNVGLRFVRTEERIHNNISGTGDPDAVTGSDFGPYVPVITEHTYNDLLPSVNFKYEVSDDMVARLAVSRTMTRPDYSALAGAISLSPPSTDGGIGSGSGGNPDLEPILSTNFDASLEWYFAPRALLAGSVFYMDLKNYVGYGHVTQQYMTYSTTTPQGYLADYVLTVPYNTDGKVKGFELTYEQPIGEYFGINANYTYADAEEKGGGDLVGTSKNTYNIGGYFENDRFNARINYTFRSSFYSGLDRATAYYQDDTDVVNVSLGYKVADWMTVTLDGLNLNEPKLKYYALNKDQPRSIYQNGRQYYLNFRFKF
ncbi:TonB-dependent receptor [Pseudoxanthomonas kalamensis DSM 18571]|uniref:TonB-dependent receptor n=1 Tax=Pseudoxanthomonas kalamensis TaxID=289483 RepID=UPI001391FD69|nr:TonB-dependent receptor [Pseudoxanthomonas kalamensis]KAF1712127.1 TonB-dependent receptor [Pseudoxanthomonas kalamensis DSM 18571]